MNAMKTRLYGFFKKIQKKLKHFGAMKSSWVLATVSTGQVSLTDAWTC